MRRFSGLLKVFVANGEDGSLRVLYGDSFKSSGEVSFSDDADNVRYDPVARHVYVGSGRGARGMLGEIHRPQGIPCNLIGTLP